MTRGITRWRAWGRLNWRVEWKPSDLWLGVFLGTPWGRYLERNIYVCLLPMLPIHICWMPEIAPVEWKEG